MSQTNPAMREDLFQGNAGTWNQTDTSMGVMTLRGTTQKICILLALVLATAIVGYAMPIMPLAIGAVVVTIALALFIGFKPHLAPTLAPIYALVQGYTVGVISYITSAQLAKSAIGAAAIPIAVAGTLFALGITLFLYAKRIVVLSNKVKNVIIGATAAIFLTYTAMFVVSLFAPGWVGGLAIFGGGPIGIAFSVLVIGLATMNFFLDYEMIETGIQNRAPAYMEWYGAFGVVVTVIWLYIEILRLLRKLQR